MNIPTCVKMWKIVPFFFLGFFYINSAVSEDPIITTKDVNIYFFSRSNLDEPDVLSSANLSDLHESHYNRSLPNYFIFHGSWDNYTSLLKIKVPLLDSIDVNVFMVDYNGPASNFSWRPYTIQYAGSIMADYINLMKQEYGLQAENFTLIGFSLGGQIVGEVGRNLDGDVGTIVSLDPGVIAPTYISADKGQFVQVIHTSIMGLQTAVGNADYFVNTVNQPGCNENVECCHIRATLYFAESLATGGFTATKCDSYDSFSEGLCDDNEKSHLGGIDIDRSANGSYFLKTNSEPPFSIDSSNSISLGKTKLLWLVICYWLINIVRSV